MSSGPLRVGVIGTGSLGYHHARLLRDVRGASFRGFFESNADRAGTVSRELGIRAFPTLDALLADVDVVSIAVPTSYHHQVAKAALEAGKHVLIEKPITTTIEEADELLAITQRTGALVQIGHIERFNRAIRAAAPYIDGPLFLDSDRLAPFNPRGADVAVVLDLMIHDIDLLLSLVGSKVRDVSAAGIPVLTPSVDIANARIAFENGAVATITASRVSRDRMRKLRIFQRNGYLSLDLAAGTGELFRMKPGLDLASLAKAAQERIMTDRFRVYTNSDMTGVEWAGALKNVIGIAAGICDGLELGDNAKAAMLTRGLAEIARSGEALGADPATFSGLAGVGDLLTTCFSPHGRNRRLGHRIGRGESLEAALGAGRQVVEGVNTVRALAPLAKSRGWDMPICQGVHDVLFGDISPRHAVENLLLRAPRPEFIPKQGKNA